MNRQIIAITLLALWAILCTPFSGLSSLTFAQEPAPRVPRSGPRFTLPPILSRIIPRVTEEIRKEELRKEEARKAQAIANAAKEKQAKEAMDAKSNASKNAVAPPVFKSEDPKPTTNIVATKRPIPLSPNNKIEVPQTSEPELPAAAPIRDPGIFSVLVSEKNPSTSTWKPLFNGKDLKSWQSSKFGGDGEITVADGAIVLGAGGDMTGVTYTGEVPKMNYALEVEAQRRDGSDFFAGITFPVADSHVTLVPGGWGGGVFGISCINLNDASENETTKPKTFDDKKWYTFRIQVTESRIQVWVDGKEEIDLITTDKKLSTRGEVEASKPLGICTWRTEGAIRAIKLRSLTPQEILAATPKK